MCVRGGLLDDAESLEWHRRGALGHTGQKVDFDPTVTSS